MTTLDLIHHQRPLKRFWSWNSGFSPTQHTVQMSSHLITILSDR